MSHEHLPALKRYTSRQQYEALQKISENKSIVPLLMQGSCSKTVGSLLRSAWIAPLTYTDDAGVVKEGWSVTDAGRHAMGLYEAKLEEQARYEALQEKRRALDRERETALFEMSAHYYRELKVLKAYEGVVEELRRRCKLQENRCDNFAREFHIYNSRYTFERAYKAVSAEPAIVIPTEEGESK